MRVNEPVLAAVLATIKALAGRVDAAEPRLDGILSLKGVIEVIDEDEQEDERQAAEAAVIAGFRTTVAELAAMRRHEGEALGQILTQRVKEIATLAARADAAPGRRPEAIKARIAEQVAVLLDTSEPVRPRPAASGGDPDRQQGRHPRGARSACLACRAGRAADRRRRRGRPPARLPRQELNREANTLCSKSNDVELTNIGLELKSVVEQFREQVQNLE